MLNLLPALACRPFDTYRLLASSYQSILLPKPVHILRFNPRHNPYAWSLRRSPPESYLCSQQRAILPLSIPTKITVQVTDHIAFLNYQPLFLMDLRRWVAVVLTLYTAINTTFALPHLPVQHRVGLPLVHPPPNGYAVVANKSTTGPSS